MRSTRRQFLGAFLAALLAITTVGSALAAFPEMPRTIHGIDPRDMDRSVDPAEDFYRFANGGWLDRTEIPADEGAYGVFNEIDDLTTDQLLGLLNDLSTGADLPEGSDEWKAVALFAQGMDLDLRDAQGVEPIQPMLDEINAIASLEDFHDFQEGAGFRWLTALFYTFVIPDFEDSSVNTTYLSGPFIGLPNRDYYLEDDAANEAVRKAYVATCAELLTYAGYDDAQAQDAAQAVYDLEHSLVEPTLTREDRLVCEAAAPFSCSRRLDHDSLRTLNCYEQMRDNMEHFDERLPNGESREWMTREEIVNENFTIVHRFPDAGRGRIVLNGVEMEFSTRQVEKIVLAADTLHSQIRSAVFKDLRRHLRQNHKDIPTKVNRPVYFQHEVRAMD